MVISIGKWIYLKPTCKISTNNNSAHNSTQGNNCIFKKAILVLEESKEIQTSELDQGNLKHNILLQKLWKIRAIQY